MLIKNNVFVHQIYHIVQDNIVLLAIFQDIGIRKLEDAKVVNKMHILILFKDHV